MAICGFGSYPRDGNLQRRRLSQHPQQRHPRQPRAQPEEPEGPEGLEAAGRHHGVGAHMMNGDRLGTTWLKNCGKPINGDNIRVYYCLLLNMMNDEHTIMWKTQKSPSTGEVYEIG